MTAKVEGNINVICKVNRIVVKSGAVTPVVGKLTVNCVPVVIKVNDNTLIGVRLGGLYCEILAVLNESVVSSFLCAVLVKLGYADCI